MLALEYAPVSVRVTRVLKSFEVCIVERIDYCLFIHCENYQAYIFSHHITFSADVPTVKTYVIDCQCQLRQMAFYLCQAGHVSAGVCVSAQELRIF